MTVMLDHAIQHGGLEKPQDGIQTKTCPRCGSDTIASFGLMGGGVGHYVMCDGERNDESVGVYCGWFYKEQSKDQDSP